MSRKRQSHRWTRKVPFSNNGQYSYHPVFSVTIRTDAGVFPFPVKPDSKIEGLLEALSVEPNKILVIDPNSPIEVDRMDGTTVMYKNLEEFLQWDDRVHGVWHEMGKVLGLKVVEAMGRGSFASRLLSGLR